MLIFIAGGHTDMWHSQSKFTVKPWYLKMSLEYFETWQVFILNSLSWET